MTVRHDRSSTRASRTAVLAGAGVTGLAALFVAPTVAHAAPAPAGDTADQGSTSKSSAAERKADAITPDYGYQKYRVGVRGKDGDFYPGDTTTAKTTFAVTVTPEEGEATTTPCESQPNTPNVVTEATFCPGDNKYAPGPESRKAASVNEPGSPFDGNTYLAQPGDTITVTQTTVQDGLVKDTSTATLKPCLVNENDFGRNCGSAGNGLGAPVSTDLVFVDPGIPPAAGDDSATTEQGTAVTIDLAANDDPKQAPVLGVKIEGDPEDGTAGLVTTAPAPTSSASSVSSSASSSAITEMRRAAGSRSLAAVTSYRAVYTPKAGFTGVDTFRYSITTANGTAAATVTVRVLAAEQQASATTSDGVSADTDDRNDLADTGAQSGELVGYGAALLAAGAGALALGTQRRRGRHAR